MQRRGAGGGGWVGGEGWGLPRQTEEHMQKHSVISGINSLLLQQGEKPLKAMLIL